MNSLSFIPLVTISGWFDQQVRSKEGHAELEMFSDFRDAMLRRLRTVQEKCISGELPATGPLNSQFDFEQYMMTRCELAATEFLRETMPQSKVFQPHKCEA